MNDIFDFGRFGKLFVYECRNYLPRYMKGLVVFSSVLFAAWMLTIAMDFPLRDGTNVISVLYTLAIFLSPYFIYKDMNNRKRGYSYAMIPASTLEKPALNDSGINICCSAGCVRVADPYRCGALCPFVHRHRRVPAILFLQSI